MKHHHASNAPRKYIQHSKHKLQASARLVNAGAGSLKHLQKWPPLLVQEHAMFTWEWMYMAGERLVEARPIVPTVSDAKPSEMAGIAIFN
eukprot:1156156-Pelagomonas_calceolata.AAC.4